VPDASGLVPTDVWLAAPALAPDVKRLVCMD
jgi:hypothetical protein